jgi:hypothetical protein
MSLNRDEIKEQYKWLTSGSKECIVLEQKDYESLMDDNSELSIIEVKECDATKIVQNNQEIFQNAQRIVISFITSQEYSFLNISMFVESIEESLPKSIQKSCEIIFTSHPNETMSDDECCVVVLVKYNEGI